MKHEIGAKPNVTVIVPCRNEAKHIEDCLNSILCQDPIPGGLEIVVADGLSDDGTREILDRMATRDSRIRIIDNPARIVSTGLNAAICIARGDIIIRMDAHAEYASDYVQCCIKCLIETKADNVGGPPLVKAKSYMQKCNCLAFHSPFAVGGARSHNLEYEGWIDTVTFGTWKKSTLDKIGFFDEELVRNQDDELNLRIIRSGGKIWQSPEIKFWYYPRSSLRAIFKQYMQYGYWKVRVIQKHKLPASVRHLVPGLFVGALTVLFLLSPFFSSSALILIFLLGFYGVVSIIAAFLTCRKPQDWKFVPAMPLVFSAYHFGYGYGFLRGIIDFLILKNKPGESLKKLTRSG